MKDSRELQQMKLEGKGYRNEAYSGSGARLLEDILSYEIGSLGNTDIIFYMNERYNAGLDLSVTMSEEEKTQLSEKELATEILEAQSLMVVENYDYYVDEIIKFLKEKLGDKSLYGIWLTIEVNAFYRYGIAGENKVDSYQIKEDFIPISDLGGDGTLFVMTCPPSDLFISSKTATR